MYERLESGRMFEGSRVSGIAGRVVDQAQTITISVFIPEGKAEIVEPIIYPSTFTPGVPFDITVRVKNTGTYEDDMFVNIDNTTPGYEENIGSQFQRIAVGASKDFIIPVGTEYNPIVQEIDLIVLIEVGHVED